MDSLVPDRDVLAAFEEARKAIEADYSAGAGIAEIRQNLLDSIQELETSRKDMSYKAQETLHLADEYKSRLATKDYQISFLKGKLEMMDRGLKRLNIFNLITEMGREYSQKLLKVAAQDFTALVSGDLDKCGSKEVNDLVNVLKE